MKKFGVKAAVQVILLSCVVIFILSIAFLFNKSKVLESKCEKKDIIISELNRQNSELNQRIIDLEQQIMSKVSDETYLSIAFPEEEGGYLIEKTGEIQFYKDPDCKIPLDNVRLMSRECKFRFLDDGRHIYASRRDDGTICYTKQDLFLQLTFIASEETTNVDENASSKESLDTYLSLIFPSDGNYYKENTGEVLFYAEPTCETELPEVKLMSSTEEILRISEDCYVYAVRMDNGKICYTRDSVKLIKVE